MMLMDTVALKAAEKVEATMGHRAAFAAYRTAVLGVQSLEARRLAIVGAGRSAMVLAMEDAEPLNTVIGWWASMSLAPEVSWADDEISHHASLWSKELVRRALQVREPQGGARELALALVRAEWRRSKAADAAYLGARVFEALAMTEDAERWYNRTLEVLDATRGSGGGGDKRKVLLREATMVQLARLGKQRGDLSSFARWKRVAEESGAPREAKEEAALELLCSDSKYDRTLALSILLEAKECLRPVAWLAVVRWASWSTLPPAPMELEKGFALAGKLPAGAPVRTLLESLLRGEQDVSIATRADENRGSDLARGLLEEMRTLASSDEGDVDVESLVRSLKRLEGAMSPNDASAAWGLLDVVPCVVALVAILAARKDFPGLSVLSGRLVHRAIELGCVYDDDTFARIAERLGRTERIALLSALVQRGRRQWKQALQNDLYVEALSEERAGNSRKALDLIERVKGLSKE